MTPSSAVPGAGTRGVDLWFLSLSELRSESETWLDPAEVHRAASYRQLADRQRFVLGVAITRATAAARLSCHPSEVRIDRSCQNCGQPHGWPRLPDLANLHLSISHSGNLVALAAAELFTVGVDLEQLDGPELTESALTTMLTAAEIAGLPEIQPQRQHAALKFWVAKEAGLKAARTGLRVDPTTIEVQQDLGGAESIHSPVFTGQIIRPTVHPGYVAAIAIPGDDEVVFTEHRTFPTPESAS